MSRVLDYGPILVDRIDVLFVRFGSKVAALTFAALFTRTLPGVVTLTINEMLWETLRDSVGMMQLMVPVPPRVGAEQLHDPTLMLTNLLPAGTESFKINCLPSTDRGS